MFHRLLDLLYDFRNYVVLAALVIVSLGLLALNDNAQVKFIRSVMSVAFGLAQEQVDFIPAYVNLRSENKTLRRLNVEYADEAYRMREAKLENIRLHGLLRLKETSTHRYLTASVVGKNLTQLRNTLTLNIGARDSVRERMPVVNEFGLVGLVIAVTSSHSIVNILLNSDFRASVKIQRSRVDGILAWDGVSLLMKNIPKTRDVKPGDVVITSEYSNTFPSDIRIGLVEDVRDQPSSLFKTVIVTPSVDFVKLEEVFLVDFQPNLERAQLEQRVVGGVR